MQAKQSFFKFPHCIEQMLLRKFFRFGGNKTMTKSHLAIRALVEGALLVAVAQILSYLKIWKMPWGGSVVLAMVPIILYAARWGLKKGLVASIVFGILQFLFDGGFAIGWQSILGDYVIAYGVLGFAGLAKAKPMVGTLIGGGARFLVHYVVGATVWAEYMPETYFGMTMSTPWFYSLLYNLAYMLPNIIITLVIFAILSATPVKKYLSGADLQQA